MMHNQAPVTRGWVHLQSPLANSMTSVPMQAGRLEIIPIVVLLTRRYPHA
jgi:hypothetical protein